MRSLAGLLTVVWASLLPASLPAAGQGRHVVLIVWDGMRPDFISEQNTPALFQLGRRGVMFRNHHAVFLSSTEVNGTAISTGAYPAHDGIIGNNEYRPEIDPLKPIHMESPDAVRKGDQVTHGHYIRLPTIAELVRREGRKAVVVGAKPVALLADRALRTSSNQGINIFAGASLPSDLMPTLRNLFGAFPEEKSLDPTRIDWSTSALIDFLWKEEVPDFSFVWMNEPDLSQHQTGPGSQRSLAAMRNADQNLARILRALEIKGVRDSTDVIVVSDHGASTVATLQDLAEALSKAGIPARRQFTEKPAPGDVLVVGNGGAVLIYAIGQNRGIVQRVVRFLQQWELSGVIFCRDSLPGTFSLHEAHLDSEAAPDILVSLSWTADKNQFGTAGMVSSDLSSYGPGKGSHVTLSPFDMHATLVAGGPHFRSGVVNTLASGNMDIAPTVLWILGLKPPPRSMDGRVLSEALTMKGPPLHSFEPRHVEASADLGDSAWTQYLNFTEVNGVRYLDEGNGHNWRR